MPKTAPLLFAATLAFAAVGCVPFLTFTDFTPQMVGGEIRISNCAGKESVEYKVEGVRLVSSLSMRSSTGEKSPVLYVFFSIPAGTKIELLSREILVMSPPTTAFKQVSISGFRNPLIPAQTRRGPPLTDSGEINFRDMTATGSFAIDVPLTGMPVGDFRIELPSMLINDNVVKIPPIEFKKFQRVEIFAPLNC
jgi:hypothetical protein